MAKFRKILLWVLGLIVILPIAAFTGLYLFGAYLFYDADVKLRAIGEQQEQAATAGNGYGGEPGLKILDSGHRAPTTFFWIDDQNLAFKTEGEGTGVNQAPATFVWNPELGTIKLLLVEGHINCWHDGNLYFVRPSRWDEQPGAEKRAGKYQATVKELADGWVVENPQIIESIWQMPDERYKMHWRPECRPSAELKSELRTDEDVPHHNYIRLARWNWILRMPDFGPSNYEQKDPPMGFFALEEDVYFGQTGVKMAELIDLSPADLPSLKSVYIDYLDKYWLFTDVYGNREREILLGFLDQHGGFERVSWPPEWPEYTEMPVPTKKGLVWSGYDYRLPKPSHLDKGTFLRDRDGRVLKVAHGSGLNFKLSSDGCKLAFFGVPRDDKGSTASLKIFDACKSSMDGEELSDANYGYRSDQATGAGL